jgi:PAS domain S-box-containing protein
MGKCEESAMRRNDTAFRYALAILAMGIALGVRHFLIPVLGYQNPYHTLWLAVVFSAWYCGLGPSIVTTVLGALGVSYWFLPPIDSFAIQDRTEAFGLFGFLVFSTAIIALGESNRRGSAARAKLAAIVECSEDAIISKDLNGVITSWNAGAQQIFGFSPEAAIGESITLIIPPELRDEETQILHRLRQGERIEHFETVRLNKSGGRLDVSLTISPLRGPSGEILGASKVARDITGRKQAEEAIKESELSARLLRLQDEERRRLARELHDGVGQLLAAMNMNAAMLKGETAKLSPDAARSAEENGKLIEQVSADIRTVSYLLHPPLLDEVGLNSALKWYVEGFAERSKIAANLELPAKWERLPGDYELCLFRIAQECLTNIHRHSGGRTAQVRLQRTAGEITLEVSDDGQGVNPEIQSKISAGETAGVGLRGMRERLRHLGGSLRIDSNCHGTTVIATVPLAEPPGGKQRSAAA